MVKTPITITLAEILRPDFDPDEPLLVPMKTPAERVDVASVNGTVCRCGEIGERGTRCRVCRVDLGPTFRLGWQCRCGYRNESRDGQHMRPTCFACGLASVDAAVRLWGG